MAILFNFIDAVTMIHQGATWGHVIAMQDEDGDIFPLTGYDAEMTVKETHESTTTLLSLTVANGRIVIDEAGGTITLTVSATDTLALDWKRGVYNLDIDKDGVVTRLYYGSIEVMEKV